MYKVLAPTPPSHSLAILAVNSVPLSEGMWAGHCPGHHQVRHRVDDVRGPDAPLRPDGQALPSVLVDQGQQPHRPAVPGPDMDKAIGHTWFLFSGLKPGARPVAQPQSASPGMPGRYLQPLPPPDPLHPFVIHHPAAAPEQGGDPAVPIATVPGGQGHMSLVRACSSSTTTGSYRWAEQVRWTPLFWSTSRTLQARPS